jgi:hypothetical protein
VIQLALHSSCPDTFGPTLYQHARDYQISTMWWPSSIKFVLLVVAVDIIDGSGFGGSREGEQQQLTNSYQDSVSPGDLAKALAALNATMSGQIVDLRAQVADLRSQLHPEARDGAKKPGNAGTNRMPEQEQPPLHVHGVHVAADSQQAKPLPLAATCSAGGPAESCEENRFGFVCSPFNGGEPCCTCKFNCTPVVTRMIACTAKTGSVMYGACTPTSAATPSLTSLDPLSHTRPSPPPRRTCRACSQGTTTSERHCAPRSPTTASGCHRWAAPPA